MTQKTMHVGDVMTREVRTVQRNDELALADGLMRENSIRHLPVLDEDGQVCAVVSQRDLFRGALLRALGYGSRAAETMLRQVVVKEAMSSELHATTPDALVADAARVMIERKIGCLPVVDGGKLVGIVSETDFVRLVAEDRLRES